MKYEECIDRIFTAAFSWKYDYMAYKNKDDRDRADEIFKRRIKTEILNAAELSKIQGDK